MNYCHVAWSPNLFILIAILDVRKLVIDTNVEVTTLFPNHVVTARTWGNIDMQCWHGDPLFLAYRPAKKVAMIGFAPQAISLTPFPSEVSTIS